MTAIESMQPENGIWLPVQGHARLQEALEQGDSSTQLMVHTAVSKGRGISGAYPAADFRRRFLRVSTHAEITRQFAPSNAVHIESLVTFTASGGQWRLSARSDRRSG